MMQPARLQSIQALRGFASVSVMFGHLIGEVQVLFPDAPRFGFFPWLNGVDIFFVISGFIIYYTTSNEFGAQGAWLEFVRKRIIRVVPLYYLFTTLIVLVLVAFPAGVRSTMLDIPQIILSYMFIPFERHDGRNVPVLSLGWTLNYEMFFYLTFSWFLFFKRNIAVVTYVCFMIGLVIYGRIGQPESSVLQFWFGSIILEFVAGIILALLFIRNRKFAVRNWMWIGSICGSMSLFVVFMLVDERIVDLPRAISGGLPALMLVASCVFLVPADVEGNLPKVVTALGDSSYALYLSHRFLFRICTLAFLLIVSHELRSWWVYIGVTAPACLVGGYLVFRFIERPILRASAIIWPRRIKAKRNYRPSELERVAADGWRE